MKGDMNFKTVSSPALDLYFQNALKMASVLSSWRYTMACTILLYLIISAHASIRHKDDVRGCPPCHMGGIWKVSSDPLDLPLCLKSCDF